MRKYWYFFKLSLQRSMADRADLYLEIVGSLVFTCAVIAVWFAVVQGKQSMAGIERNTLITYLLIAGLLMSFYRRAQGDEVSDDIYHGVLSGYLVKPVNPLALWCIRDFSLRLLELPVVGGLGILLFPLLPLQFGAGKVNLLFLFLLPFAWLLHFFLYTTLALLAFWLEQTWGERFVLNVVLEIASGAFVPLTFFPLFWNDLLRALPFSHLVATPVEFLTGMKTFTHDYPLLLVMGGWLVISFLVMNAVWRRGVRRHEGVGI